MEAWSIPAGLLETAGPWTILISFVGFCVTGLFKGWIVPKPIVDLILARAVAAETANEKLTANNAELIQAQIKNAAVGEAVEKIVDAIQDAQKAGNTA